MMAMLRRDPGLFVLTCALWASINGASLLAPGETFRIAAIYYQEVVRLGLREDWVGAAMLADAAALFLTVSRGSAGARSLVAVLSAPAWFFFGALMLISAAHAGLFTVVGAYDVVAALGLAACGAQWPHTLGAYTSGAHTPPPSPVTSAFPQSGNRLSPVSEDAPWT